MESRRMLKQLLVLTCCLLTALAQMATSLQEDYVRDPYDHYGSVTEARRDSQKDINKLLLKHLRFRQLPEDGVSSIANGGTDINNILLKHLRFRQLPETGIPTTAEFESAGHESGEKVDKRQEQSSLVNNLAALLSGLRDRQSESNMRMPSLRFG